MGGIISRISPDVTFDRGLNESFNRLKNSFDRTPKYKIIDDKMFDPRSATLEINRTPLCLLDIDDESDMGTPVTRNRRKSKRRSVSRFSDAETSRSEVSRSFEFSPTPLECSSESHLVPWEPRPQQDLYDISDNGITVDTMSPPEKKYEKVVEDLRQCLGKVSMTPVYIDDETVDRSKFIETPPNSKDLKKKLFWTPGPMNQAPLSPSTKERTPLGLVNSNMASSRINSSALWRGGKIWRGPADERAKLQGENTPPSALPPFGQPCSAPPTNRHLRSSLK